MRKPKIYKHNAKGKNVTTLCIYKIGGEAMCEIQSACFFNSVLSWRFHLEITEKSMITRAVTNLKNMTSCMEHILIQLYNRLLTRGSSNFYSFKEISNLPGYCVIF